MTAADRPVPGASPVVIFDERVLWHLARGTRIREIGTTGRTFIVGRIPGQLWVGNTPSLVRVVEMPVEVIPQ